MILPPVIMPFPAMMIFGRWSLLIIFDSSTLMVSRRPGNHDKRPPHACNSADQGRMAEWLARSMQKGKQNERFIMQSWSIIFLILTLISGILGFTGIAGAAAGIGKTLFVVFLTLLLISAISGSVQGKAS